MVTEDSPTHMVTEELPLTGEDIPDHHGPSSPTVLIRKVNLSVSG